MFGICSLSFSSYTHTSKDICKFLDPILVMGIEISFETLKFQWLAIAEI